MQPRARITPFSAPFEDGNFETIYLAPSNYHRIHMPMAGTLRKIIYIPGKYYSVNPDYVERIEGLFAKNERAVAIFDTAAGPMALVFVGATIVGSIGITGIGIISPNKERRIKVTEFPAETAPTYAKGEEIGYFKLGSTVITIFGKKSVTLSPEQKSGSAVKMGTLMGYVAGNAAGTKSPDSETEEDKPAAEEPVQEEAPAPEKPAQEEAPVSEESVHGEPPASEEFVQEEAPAAEEAVQEEAPASEEPAQEEAPASEESVQDDILIYDEPVQEEAPVSEEPAEDSASGETAQPQKKASAASGRKDTAKRSRKSKSGKRK